MNASPLQIAATRACTHMEVCSAELATTTDALIAALPHPLPATTVRLLQQLLTTSTVLRNSAARLDEALQ